MNSKHFIITLEVKDARHLQQLERAMDIVRFDLDNLSMGMADEVMVKVEEAELEFGQYHRGMGSEPLAVGKQPPTRGREYFTRPVGEWVKLTDAHWWGQHKRREGQADG